MVGWHHQLDGHEFEQAPGVGEGQRGLVYCSPWGCKESDTTEWLNWIAVQYFAGFCHTSTWINYGYHMSPPFEPLSHLPIHPTSLGCLRALGLSFLPHNSKFPLAIYFTYGNAYVSMLFSQFIPPSLFPTCVRHLEKRYWWTYLQDSNGDANMENRLWTCIFESYPSLGVTRGAPNLTWKQSILLSLL